MAILNVPRWHFFNDPTHDPEYLLWLPMAKTGVRAMDTVENFLTSDTAPEEVGVWQKNIKKKHVK